MSTHSDIVAKSKDFMNTVQSFDFSNPNIKHDAIIVVEGKKFHVTSEYLATWAECFEGLISADSGETSFEETKYGKVLAEDFKKFLDFIYPSNTEVSQNNVISLIKMAHRFLAPAVMIACKKYIDNNLDKIDLIDLLEVAMKYDISDVKEKIGSLIYASPAKGSGHNRCNLCPFSYDDACCQHDDLGSEIMVNSFIDEHLDRIMKLSNEAKLVQSFDFSNPNIKHDAIIVVEGTKFHVTSEYLATWAECFEGLISADSGETSFEETEHGKVLAEDFKKFLDFIYPSNTEVSENNVISLINMAHRFLAPAVMIACKKFIDNNLDKIDLFDLLEVAMKYDISDVKMRIGSVIFAAEGAVTYKYRCDSCNYCYNDEEYCSHKTINEDNAISVNSFIHENRNRIIQASKEVQTFIMMASVGEYEISA